MLQSRLQKLIAAICNWNECVDLDAYFFVLRGDFNANCVVALRLLQLTQPCKKSSAELHRWIIYYKLYRFFIGDPYYANVEHTDCKFDVSDYFNTCTSRQQV